MRDRRAATTEKEQQARVQAAMRVLAEIKDTWAIAPYVDAKAVLAAADAAAPGGGVVSREEHDELRAAAKRVVVVERAIDWKGSWLNFEGALELALALDRLRALLDGGGNGD